VTNGEGMVVGKPYDTLTSFATAVNCTQGFTGIFFRVNVGNRGWIPYREAYHEAKLAAAMAASNIQ